MILLIGGTSETAPLAEGLAAAGYAVLVSTATDAPLAIGEHPRISRRTGRLDEDGLTALSKAKGIRAIVDAAHPYAVELHATVQKATRHLGIPCLTYRRPEAFAPDGDNCRAPANTTTMMKAAGGANGLPASRSPSRSGSGARDSRRIFATPQIRFAADHAEAAALAFADSRPVLLTTGSRNLAPYAEQARRTGIPLAVRVLDTAESLAACRVAGIAAERILAERGPFTLKENLAAIGRFDIGVLVTKESGSAGGFPEKLAAAEAAGCLLVVIGRPPIAAGPTFKSPAALIEALVSLLPPGPFQG